MESPGAVPGVSHLTAAAWLREGPAATRYSAQTPSVPQRPFSVLDPPGAPRVSRFFGLLWVETRLVQTLWQFRPCPGLPSPPIALASPGECGGSCGSPARHTCVTRECAGTEAPRGRPSASGLAVRYYQTAPHTACSYTRRSNRSGRCWRCRVQLGVLRGPPSLPAMAPLLALPLPLGFSRTHPSLWVTPAPDMGPAWTSARERVTSGGCWARWRVRTGGRARLTPHHRR